MRRAVLAAVLATGAAAVQAGDTTSVYGVVDIGLATGHGAGEGHAGLMRDGGLAGNRVGVRSEEALGTGTRLVLTLETGYLPGTGGQHRPGRTFSRQAWAGLAGPLGSLTLGYQYAPGYLIPGHFQVLGGSAGFAPRSTLAFAGGYTMTPGSAGRFDNALRYEAPRVGPFEWQAIYAFHARQADGGSGARGDDDRWGVGLRYDGGPLKAALVHHRVGSAEGPIREWFLGASWDTGPLRWVGTWSRKDSPGATEDDNLLVSVGVVVAVGDAGSASIGAARLAPRGPHNDGRALAAGYIHVLSPRTRGYVALNRLEYDSAAGYLDRPGAVVTLATPGEAALSLIAGISHVF